MSDKLLDDVNYYGINSISIAIFFDSKGRILNLITDEHLLKNQRLYQLGK